MLLTRVVRSPVNFSIMKFVNFWVTSSSPPPALTGGTSPRTAELSLRLRWCWSWPSTVRLERWCAVPAEDVVQSAASATAAAQRAGATISSHLGVICVLHSDDQTKPGRSAPTARAFRSGSRFDLKSAKNWLETEV